MQETRPSQRVSFRLGVDVLHCDGATPRRCLTRDICIDGLFATGVQGLAVGQVVHLTIGGDGGERIDLDARVVGLGSDGADFEFVGVGTQQHEALRRMLTPSWSGTYLLDGVVRMAPWYRENNLAGWLRLTSLVSDWHRLTQRSALTG